MNIKKTGSNNFYKYSILLDINKDAWNWQVGCNNIFEGIEIDWSKYAPTEIVQKIRGKNQDESFVILKPYLENIYEKDKYKIDYFTQLINDCYSVNFQKGCENIVKTIKRPLYRNTFTTYLTTFPRAPYVYESGETWVPIGWLDPMRMFLHELLHFQFIHYWRNNPGSKVSELPNPQFQWLKESLTVILDDEFFPLIEKVDKGYEKHHDFRIVLHEHWKKHHDFDKLVEFGLEKLPDYFKDDQWKP